MPHQLSYQELENYCSYLEEKITDTNEVRSQQQESGITDNPLYQYSLLRTLVDSTDSIILSLDRRYRLMSSNPAHVKVMKNAYGVDIKVGDCLLDYISSEEDKKALIPIYERVLSGEAFSITDCYGTLTRHYYETFYNPIYFKRTQVIGLAVVARDVTERKKTEEERDQLVIKLQQALNNIKTLKGIIPICSSCNKIRDDKGFWNRVEAYVSQHTQAEFSHSVCPDCAIKLYPEYAHLFS